MTNVNNTLIQKSIQSFPVKRGIRFRDLSGQTFGKLTATEVIGKDSNGQFFWNCTCKCGNLKKVRSTHLTRGAVKSCGCSMGRYGNGQRITADKKQFGWRSWKCIQNRCYQRSTGNWKYYGALGIKMCAAIKGSFDYFASIVGVKPTPKHQVDRINPFGHYSCGECEECLREGWTMNIRWATQIENQNNKRRHLKI